MKSFIVIGSILAASQCAPEPSDPDVIDAKPTTTTTSTTSTGAAEADAGEASAPDLGAAPAPGAWLEPGPPPFTVPTVRMAIPELNATMLVPVGVRAQSTASGVIVALGEGANFEMHVGDSAANLADVHAMLSGETEEPTARDDGALVWEEDGGWFFQVSGTFSCWNSGDARHGRDDVEMMIASCRSAELTAEAPAP